MQKTWALALLALVLPAGSLAQTPAQPAPAAPAAAPPALSGEAVYASNCSACHQPTGLGISGPFPALAANTLVTGPPDVLTTTVLMGRGGMPAFKNELGDDDMAAVLTYIRGAWGNTAAPVAKADVVAFRAKAAAEAQPKDLQAH
ncbi:cytochrome c [Phenylobacterium sp.]|uniref:c-type cytochrome n=1 Tax=Phenylobacterium sp. TaxID=1871053 RepID=UPI0025CD3EAB|nr:cytochrome c [Phenylobacterium sp.]